MPNGATQSGCWNTGYPALCHTVPLCALVGKHPVSSPPDNFYLPDKFLNLTYDWPRLPDTYEIKLSGGGLSINGCSANRGYRLAPADFINLSHGVRAENVKSGKPNPDTESLSWRSSSNSQNQSSRSNTSAFASFNNQDGFSPAFMKGEINLPVSPMRILKKNNDQTKSSYKSVEQHVKSNRGEVQSKPHELAIRRETNPVADPKNENEPEYDLQDGREHSLQTSSEFQALWNELHRLQKSSGSHSQQKQPATPTVETKRSFGTPTDSPQDPSAFLKAMLKISDDNSQKNTSSNKPPAFPQLSKSSDAPPLVQQLFDLHSYSVEQGTLVSFRESAAIDVSSSNANNMSITETHGCKDLHARQAGSTKRTNAVSYCSQLLAYFQLKGMGMPRYNYVPNKETNFICARIFLPDMRTFSGEFCPTRELAAESAAKRVYTELNLNTVAEPGVNILPTPPQQWYNTRHNAVQPPNIRPMINGPPSMPPMIMPNPFMRAFNGSPNVPPNLNNPNLMPNFSQIRPQQRHQPITGAGSKNWRTENNKSENRKSAPFVPLQAQKQHRNTNPRHSTGSTNSSSNSHHGQQQKLECKTNDGSSKVKEEKIADSPESRTVQKGPQNQPKYQQRSGRQRKSRIAANFGSPPVTNGDDPK